MGTAILLAATLVGVDFGWHHDAAGQLVYLVRVDPAQLADLAPGEELSSTLAPDAPRPDRIVLRVGGDPIPPSRRTPPAVKPSADAPGVARSAAVPPGLVRHVGGPAGPGPSETAWTSRDPVTTSQPVPTESFPIGTAPASPGATSSPDWRQASSGGTAPSTGDPSDLGRQFVDGLSQLGTRAEQGATGFRDTLGQYGEQVGRNGGTYAADQMRALGGRAAEAAGWTGGSTPTAAPASSGAGTSAASPYAARSYTQPAPDGGTPASLLPGGATPNGAVGGSSSGWESVPLTGGGAGASPYGPTSGATAPPNSPAPATRELAPTTSGPASAAASPGFRYGDTSFPGGRPAASPAPTRTGGNPTAPGGQTSPGTVAPRGGNPYAAAPNGSPGAGTGGYPATTTTPGYATGGTASEGSGTSGMAPYGGEGTGGRSFDGWQGGPNSGASPTAAGPGGQSSPAPNPASGIWPAPSSPAYGTNGYASEPTSGGTSGGGRVVDPRDPSASATAPGYDRADGRSDAGVGGSYADPSPRGITPSGWGGSTAGPVDGSAWQGGTADRWPAASTEATGPTGTPAGGPSPPRDRAITAPPLLSEDGSRGPRDGTTPGDPSGLEGFPPSGAGIVDAGTSTRTPPDALGGVIDRAPGRSGRGVLAPALTDDVGDEPSLGLSDGTFDSSGLGSTGQTPVFGTGTVRPVDLDDPGPALPTIQAPTLTDVAPIPTSDVASTVAQTSYVVLSTLGLIGSLGLNAYMGLVVRGIYRRYRHLVRDRRLAAVGT